MCIKVIHNKCGDSYRTCIKYKDSKGIEHSYSKTFKKRKDAEKHEKLMKAKIASEKEIKKECKKTFNQVFVEYMNTTRAKRKYAISTYNTYLSKFKKHVENTKTGKSYISALKNNDIQAYFDDLGQTNNSKALNKDIKKIFQVTFKYALKQDYIEKNPMFDIEVTGKETNKENHILSLSELEKICELLCEKRKGKDMFLNYSYCMALYVGYYTGLRISETLALEKSDIDFGSNIIQISKRLESKDRKKGLYVTSQLKTKSSYSNMPLCEPLKKVLIEWFNYNTNELVCCHENGSYIRYECFNRSILKCAKELGFRLSSHDLRHTFTTNLIRHNNDVDIKTAQELVRHSDPNTTIKIYAHSDIDQKRNAINSVFN